MRLRLPKSRERLRREAARWLAQMQSGENAETQQSFRLWINADPSHAAAFDRVRRSYEQAGLLRHSLLMSDGFTPPARPSLRLQPIYGVAAALALMLLVGGGLFLANGAFVPEATDAVMLTTRVGEIKQVRLADGSKITLDTATRVELDISRSHRRALVRSGRARFELAPAPSPFIIEAGSATAVAAKGIVDVEQFGDESRVELLAGSAEVRGGPRGADLLHVDEGRAVTAVGGQMTETKIATSQPDWTKGMLNFDGTPLGTAIALANRYSEEQIVLGPKLASLRVTGAFRAGDTNGLAKALAAAFHLSLERTTNGGLLLKKDHADRGQG